MVTVAGARQTSGMQGADLIGIFGRVGFAFAGSARPAALLFIHQQSGMGVLMAMVPLVMMLATLHHFFRQQEAAESARRPVPRPPSANGTRSPDT